MICDDICCYFLILVIFSILHTTLGLFGGWPTPDYQFFVLIYKGDDVCGGTLTAPDIVLTGKRYTYEKKVIRSMFLIPPGGLGK